MLFEPPSSLMLLPLLLLSLPSSSSLFASFHTFNLSLSIFYSPPPLSLSISLCIVNSSGRLLFTRASNCCCVALCCRFLCRCLLLFLSFLCYLFLFLCYALISGPTAKQQSKRYTTAKKTLTSTFCNIHTCHRVRTKSKIIMFNFLIAICLSKAMYTMQYTQHNVSARKKRMSLCDKTTTTPTTMATLTTNNRIATFLSLPNSYLRWT